MNNNPPLFFGSDQFEILLGQLATSAGAPARKAAASALDQITNGDPEEREEGLLLLRSLHQVLPNP